MCAKHLTSFNGLCVYILLNFFSNSTSHSFEDWEKIKSGWGSGRQEEYDGLSLFSFVKNNQCFIVKMSW